MFRLEWLRSAINELAHGWMGATSDQRRQITQAIDDLERQLAHDPLECGESRGSRRRIAFSEPVALTFEVNERLRLVTVVHVRLYSRRPR